MLCRVCPSSSSAETSLPEQPDPPTRGPVDRSVADHWVLCLGVAILTVTLLRFRAGVDADAWLHLRIGRELWAGEWFGSLPDPLVVLADRPYVPTQWLSELVGTAMFDQAGVVGLRLLRLVALLLLLLAIYAGARLTMAPARATGVVLIVGTATAAAWAERPQMAGLALAAVTVTLWGATIQDGRARWQLVPVTWLWAMLHGTWALGLATGGVAIVAAVLVHRRALRLRSLVAVLAACTLVVAATPLGPQLLVEPFAVSASARPGVNEWQAPELSNPLYVLVLVLAAVVVVRALSRRPADLAAALLAASGAGMAAYSVRTVAFGALLLVPAAARAFPSSRRPRLTRREVIPLVVAGVLVAAAPGVVWGAPSAGPLGRSVDGALAALPAGTPVAVDLGVTGWVLHRHPQVRPYRDLRAEVYTAATGAAYEELDKGRAGWRAYADEHDVRVILVVEGEALDRQLVADPTWRVTAGDGTYRLWRRG